MVDTQLIFGCSMCLGQDLLAGDLDHINALLAQLKLIFYPRLGYVQEMRPKSLDDATRDSVARVRCENGGHVIWITQPEGISTGTTSYSTS